ncbi:hypothetical protein QEV83_06850 [Methylocapsa sp. D3K7]|uniref:hypothetical protein n=1 Tax=Methylocapsa sp. D3K7 TaxID=3041435 RepID=UPI00244E83A2|nr:hypothetical protein [Methylocapsa sp. D3K7]WGJ15962.1 hypothetical protein QEV83_06850 [Methylocapsa sp. D3K7]
MMWKRNEHPEMPPCASVLIESDVLNRTGITVPAKDWKAFKAWINRPAETIPALIELARRRNFPS